MAEATFLHIQTRDASQPRVMELAGTTVRIGRGVQCEVRLSEPALADVQCLLRRRGATWHLQPVGPAGRVAIDNRPVDHQRPLPLGTPFRVGTFWLTLRRAGAAPTGFGSYEAPIPIEPSSVYETPLTPPRPEPLGDRPYADPTQAASRDFPSESPDAQRERMERWRARLEEHERWLKSRQQERRWGARWKAFGATLRARAAAASAGHPNPPPAGDLPAEPIPVEVAETVPPPRPATEAERESRPHSPTKCHGEALPPRPCVISEGTGEEPPAVAPSRSDDEDRLSSPVERNGPAARNFPPPDAGVIASCAAEAIVPAAWPCIASFAAHTAESVSESSRVEPPPSVAERPGDSAGPAADEPIHESEWPSARTILQAHTPRPSARQAHAAQSRRPAPARPEPTVPRPPSHWSVPGWLALFPTAAVVLAAGLLGLRLSWTWSRDDYAAGVVADRLLRAEAIPEGPFELPDAPAAAWWSSTPDHLHLRALAVSRGERDTRHTDEVRFLLKTAKNAAPLDTAVRLALAATEDGPSARPSSVADLGSSRDIVALRKRGKRLLEAGETGAALRVERDALELAARVDLMRVPLPTFVDDARVRRFRLPNEEAMDAIVRDLSAHRGWQFSDWSRALPANGLAPLVAYRVLRERGDPDVDAALALVLQSPAEPDQPQRAALVLAAQGEALALADRWAEAAERYRLAIPLAPAELIRRTWWINLGEIAAHLRDTDLMRTAWAAARGPSPRDEINTRMIQARARQGLDGPTKQGTRSRASTTKRRSD